MEGGSAAVGETPQQYVHSHANTASGRNHDCHTTLSNLFLALWGVTTVISFGIYGCENAIPGVLPCYKLKKKQKTGVYSYSRLIPSVFLISVTQQGPLSTSNNSF